VQSRWVYNEAITARFYKKYLPLLIPGFDPKKLPADLRAVNAGRLVDVLREPAGLVDKIRAASLANAGDPLADSLDGCVLRFGTEQDAEEIHRIAQEAFGFNASLIHPLKYVRTWLNSGKGIYRCAFVTNEYGVERRMAGFYSIVAVSLQTYEKLANGELNDKSLTSDLLLMPNEAEAIYIVDVARAQTDLIVGSYLLRDLVRYLASILHRNPGLKRIGTWTYTKEGAKVADRLGMDFVEKLDESNIFFDVVEPARHFSESSGSKVVRDWVQTPFRETYRIGG
jgi:hypothetical protein